jgi:hypothetical protein
MDGAEIPGMLRSAIGALDLIAVFFEGGISGVREYHGNIRSFKHLWPLPLCYFIASEFVDSCTMKEGSHGG